jgi:AraC family transcriptional regulator
MEPRIDTIGEKKLLGKRMTMSLSNNKTRELWQSFMSRRKEIKNAIGTDLYSMQILDSAYFSNFNPGKEFEKWAVTEVASFDDVPADMETFTLPSGLYAVFLHIGPASSGPQVFQYIFGTWLPRSEYTLDNRPHFEILGEKYKNDDSNSEEEIWIPVKLRSGL